MIKDIYKDDFSLFDYQTNSKKQIFAAWDEHKSIMFQMPTGTGKTKLFTSVIRDIVRWGNETNERVKIIVVAHRKELIEQIGDSLTKYDIPHGMIAGGYNRDLYQTVLVASIQTLAQKSQRDNYERLDANFVFIDEAHHSIAPTYKLLWDLYPNAYFLGVTATPWNMKQFDFSQLYGELIVSLQPREFMHKGRLAPYEYYSIQNNNPLYTKIHTINDYAADGDFRKNVLESEFDKISIRAQLLDSYIKYAKGKKGIIYSICREHSRHICDEYSQHGIRITDIDGDTPKTEREQKIKDFKEGKLDIIVNVDIFSEGFDCPDIQFIQLARPTRSLVKYIQQVGRGLRVSKEKEQCIILDNVGSVHDFGLPDKDRDWMQYFYGKHREYNFHEKDIDKENEGKLRTINMTEGNESMIIIASNKEKVQAKVNKEIKKRENLLEKQVVKNKSKFLKKYGDEECSSDIWNYIESHHDAIHNKVANTFAITMDDGITFFYSVTEDGRLLSVDAWFEGYVAQYGSVESGYPYAVVKEKNKIYIKEITNDYGSAKILMHASQSHLIYKTLSEKLDQPIKIIMDYYYNGKRYVVVDTPYCYSFVYNVERSKQVDKYLFYKRYTRDYKFETTILYRLPSMPYKYAIVKCKDYYSCHRIWLMHIPTRQRFCILSNVETARIIETTNGNIAIANVSNNNVKCVIANRVLDGKDCVDVYYVDKKMNKLMEGVLPNRTLDLKKFKTNCNSGIMLDILETIYDNIKNIVRISLSKPDEELVIHKCINLTNVNCDGKMSYRLTNALIESKKTGIAYSEFDQFINYYKDRSEIELTRKSKDYESFELYDYIRISVDEKIAKEIMTWLYYKNHLISFDRIKVELFVNDIKTEEHHDHKKDYIDSYYFNTCNFDIKITLDIP